MAARLALAGIDPRIYLVIARWPDQHAILGAIAEEAELVVEERLDRQAIAIANRISEMLDKSLKK